MRRSLQEVSLMADSLIESFCLKNNMTGYSCLSYVPSLNHWEFGLVVLYKYLRIYEKTIFPNNDLINFCWNEIYEIIIKTNQKILNEIEYYFNAVWC